MKVLKSFLIGLLFTTGLAYAVAPQVPQNQLQPCLTVESCVYQYGTKYSLSEAKMDLMKKVIFCESSNNRYAVGDGGKSFGLSQIHSPSHPSVTKEQAFDIDYSINFMAKNISEGRGNMWTCYRILTGI